MGIAEAIITRLLELCERRHITVNKMCSLAAVPQSTVNNFINGKTKSLGTVNLKKLIDSFDMTLPDFFDTELFRKLEQEIE